LRFCSLTNGDAGAVAVADGGSMRRVTPATSELQTVFGAVMDGAALELVSTPEADPELGPPLRPGKIVAVGLNYRMHADESGVEAPSRPLIFAKFPSSVTGPSAPIVVDSSLAERVDWEVELAVVVGRRMRHVSHADALDYVFGYTVANDVSARDVQFSDGQWTRAKSFDSFCPLGPVVVTPDELGPVDDLRLTTRVNGELMQDDSTANMIFGVPELLSFCSRCFTLDAGDVVLTGTPDGCGEFMDPPRSLAPGDVVEASIEGIGALRNEVVAANGGATTSPSEEEE
jgi:2-keto-4-pentenoate hydratase/2-oxohepta-3-ene-1,7-dioic acid hydratase in catechol pathway